MERLDESRAWRAARSESERLREAEAKELATEAEVGHSDKGFGRALLILGLAGLLLIVAIFTASGARGATAEPAEAGEFEPYVGYSWWRIEGTQGSIWPQTLLYSDTTNSFTPTAECEGYRVQYDEYNIDSQEDEDYWRSLTYLASGDDDAQLEPTNFSVSTIEGDASLCEPAPIQEWAQWYGPTPDCDNPEVVQERTLVEYSFFLSDETGEWIRGEGHVIETEQRTLTLTPQELAACEPEPTPEPTTPEPTPTPTPESTTPTTPESAPTEASPELAETGADEVTRGVLAIAGVLALIGVATLIVRRWVQ